jgi:hypothetical protein
MRKQWTDDGWRKRFAFIPIFLSDGPNHQMIWLEWFWKRDMGIFTAITFDDPRAEGMNDEG